MHHGIGKMIYNATSEEKPLVNGEYFGRWENGKRHGEGIFTYRKTNDIYSGYWQYGKKHGNGTYIYEKTKIKVRD